MDETSFDEQRIAEGYAKDRPYLHGQVIDRLREKGLLSGKYQNGLDVGCGVGLSTRALKTICDKATGTDISEEMIKVARILYKDQGFTFQKNRAEECISEEDSFDIVSALGMINWVDRTRFLKSMSSMMKEEGMLLIYDFWISDKMINCDAYTDWWNQQYMTEFPRPPRKEDIWTEKDVMQLGFHIKEQLTYEINCSFELDAFIRFMMIQSNVNVQVAEKKKTLEEIYQWFKKTLSSIFRNQERVLIFQGYAWILENKGNKRSKRNHM